MDSRHAAELRKSHGSASGGREILPPSGEVQEVQEVQGRYHLSAVSYRSVPYRWKQRRYRSDRDRRISETLNAMQCQVMTQYFVASHIPISLHHVKDTENKRLVD